MKDLISEVRLTDEYEGGHTFHEFVRWDGACTSFEERKKNMIYAQEHKVISVRQALVLDSGVEVEMPINESIIILPDRSGVLVVFGQEPYKLSSRETPWFFGYPNNAAIYNADGTLRFQVHNPYGENSYIGDIHSGAMPEHPNALGVLIGTVGHEPEWLYLVDPDAPKLVPTGKWIRY
ncbi:hypothetical protein JFT81_07385 [Pseudomonas sp. TH43]|uniref:hypothetical protein n=1 Tax=Pseudomonas sp. TH43 TaxID=2796407 RepID=UPI001911370A|nr:hypothetical protein [Pseudomonas sp. TH43]MBK5374452.1 hypothetical protein [Pseudomonas sp. TH43]